MKAQMYNYSSWVEETDPKVLIELYNKKLLDAGFGVLDVIEYHFEPQGYSALFLLSESHFAIHTFPEENQSYIELSSCVKQQFDKFITGG
mgnify:CR=1 FL=1